MDSVVVKRCCVCGVDVSRMRRTRDPRGKYYCRPCYQTLWEAHQRRVRERAALEAEATAAALLMERAVEAAVAAAAAANETDFVPQVAPEPPRAATPIMAPLNAPDGACAPPRFEIKALPAEGDHAEPLQRAFSLGRALSKAATALASLRPALEAAEDAVVPVTAHRVRRHRARNELRLSDLVGEEAQSAVEESRSRFHEPEVPVSPITNPPVSALVEDYAALVEPREPAFRVHNASLA